MNDERVPALINERDPEDPQAGVPTCDVLIALNAPWPEGVHVTEPTCRQRTIAFPTGPWSPSFALPLSVDRGTVSYVLPTTYLADYPASEYPFDDPRAEWMYFRSESDLSRAEWYGNEALAEPYQDELECISMIPYLAYEVTSERMLETEAGFLRPQITVRFWIGMMVSVQNLDRWLNAPGAPQHDEGARVVEFMSRVEWAIPRIKTFRREGTEWVGQSAMAEYDIEEGMHWIDMVEVVSIAPKVLRPSEAFYSTAGGARATLGLLLSGVVRVTETADRDFEEPLLREEMIRTGFECLVGEMVEFSYTIAIRDVDDKLPSAAVSRCLTIDDLQQVCELLDEINALQARDRNVFVFQRSDDNSLRDATVGC